MNRSSKSLAKLSLLTSGLLLLASSAFAHALEARALPTLGEYFTLGVGHILTGYDHLLFLAGLALATRRARDLFWTISAFTLAHSITLALGMLGIVTPSVPVIEVVIALSIAYVGYENLKHAQAHDSQANRVWIVFGFGLAHGFGFASAIHEVGLPAGRELGALAMFNFGVEAGQLMVVAPLLLATFFMRRFPRPALWAPRVVNAVLIVAGLGWTLERTFTAEPIEPAQSVASGLDSDESIGLTNELASLPKAAGARTDSAIANDRPFEPSPGIEPLCTVLQALPRERRAACSGTKPGVTLTTVCERSLDRSVRAGALKLDLDHVQACVAAQEARYAGCEWTEQRVLSSVPACRDLAQGMRAAGESCGSSLECGAGLHCHGAGPLDTGVCGQPLATGARCELAIDPLVAYLPQDLTSHRECEGACIRGRCSGATVGQRSVSFATPSRSTKMTGLGTL